jgi:hypothetical protein
MARQARPPTAPYSFTGLKEYADKGLPLAWRLLSPTFAALLQRHEMPVIFVVVDIMGRIRLPANQDSKEPQTQQIIFISGRLNNVYAIRGLPFLIFVRRRAYIAKPGF